MIITISGKYGCGGKAVAEKTAEVLGYRLCDDNIVEEAIRDTDEDLVSSTFRYFDESAGALSVKDLVRLSNTQRGGYYTAVSTLTQDVLPLDKKIDQVQRDVLQKFAKEGNCVLMGRCASYYLADRSDVLRVLIVDTEENCVKRLQKALEIDEAAARKLKKKVDKRRGEYFAFFSGRKYGELENYDLILNCALFDVEGCTELIRTAVAQKG